MNMAINTAALSQQQIFGQRTSVRSILSRKMAKLRQAALYIQSNINTDESVRRAREAAEAQEVLMDIKLAGTLEERSRIITEKFGAEVFGLDWANAATEQMSPLEVVIEHLESKTLFLGNSINTKAGIEKARAAIDARETLMAIDMASDAEKPQVIKDRLGIDVTSADLAAL